MASPLKEFREEILRLPDLEGSVQPFQVDFVTWVDRHGFFIRDVWKDGKFQGSGWLELQKPQRDILSYALQFDRETMHFKYQIVLYSVPKKGGKTTIAAAIACWYAEVAPPYSEIYVVANSREQAEGRVFRDIKFHAERRGYKTSQYEVTLPNGTTIFAISPSFRSAAGSRHALVVFDELWGIVTEADQRMYEEMTPIPTIPYSLQVITTYAGFFGESQLLYRLYIKGVGKEEHEDGQGKRIEALADYPCWENGNQFTLWAHEPLMEWQQDEEYYENQRLTLRPEAYLRLHENRWVTSNESFMSLEMWRQTQQMPAPADVWVEHPYRHLPVYIGIDAASRRDSTAVVGVVFSPEKGLLVEVFHRIWKPLPNQTLDFERTIEAFILDMKQRFSIAKIIYDPSHLYQTALRLQRMGFRMVEYQQTPSNMVKATQAFYDVVRLGRFMTWKDDEATAHVLAATVKTDPNLAGFRVSKPPEMRAGQRPIDYVIALILASYFAIIEGGSVFLTPIVVENPFSDAQVPSTPPILTDEGLIKKIPRELLNDEELELLEVMNGWK